MSIKVIETRDLSKRFRIGTRERMTLFSSVRYALSGEYPKKDFWALQDISFSVERGEMIAVIGPNGAGKTTLFRILSGIMAPTTGSFTVRDDVSCVFELGLGFNPRFTAVENVYLYGALHGISKKEISARLPEIVAFAELERFMGTQLGEFSSGMRARLAFATVIHTLRGIILIDEVLAVGDAAFQRKCFGAIEKILQKGHTVLFIAHGLGYAKRLCSRALYIEGGKQIAFGKVDEVEQMYMANVEKNRKEPA